LLSVLTNNALSKLKSQR
jgi:hypothetical protein